MRVLAVLAAGLLFALPATAQQKASDDLAAQAKAVMMAEPARALDLATQAEQRAAAIEDGQARATAGATALWLQSEALLRTRNAKAAAPRITRALRLIANGPASPKLRGDLLLTRAGVQQSQLRPAEALASLQEAFALFASAKDTRKQAIALQTIAALYTEANDFVSAEKYFRQAGELNNDDPVLNWALHNNRASGLLRLERTQEATAEYRQALQIAQRLKNPGMQSTVFANLARSLLVEGKLGEADAAIQAGLAIVRKTGQGSEARLLSLAADSAYRRGHLARARTLIDRSFAGVNIAETPLAFRDAHLAAYNIYSALKESAKALPHLERVRKLGDESARLATTTSNALMAARFDYSNQELRIANLKVEEERRAAQFQRTIFIGLGTATVIIITLLSFGLFTIRRSRNQVRDANIELNTSNVALEKALKAKTEFLATTSHEIRTPLNGILGMTQIMLRDPAVPAATRDRLGVVHGAGMTMRALVDDILDVAKMETGNLTVELAATDLHTTLRDVARMWEEQARAKGVGFTLDYADAPRWIETDSGRLRQMLFNLLSNAVKFTETGEIAVRVQAQGERLYLAVTDSGIGIPAEKHEEIFESFRQVDAGTTRKFGGTGLGLAIVRNLALALEGAVSVASVEGEGATFTVDLPLRIVEAPAGAVEAPEGGETIVVLDKNPIARGMLRTLFAPKFAAVEFAATPAEALERLPAGPALLLADEMTLKAAGDDPVATLRDLVAAANARGVRTAVLWAKPDAEIEAALRATSVGLLVAKPVAGATLIENLIAGQQENCKNLDASDLVSNAA
jgi:signal transduction histidine kinase